MVYLKYEPRQKKDNEKKKKKRRIEKKKKRHRLVSFAIADWLKDPSEQNVGDPIREFLMTIYKPSTF